MVSESPAGASSTPTHPNSCFWVSCLHSFVVFKRKAFVENVMPMYFRMSVFASFQRQLNMYGFQRITTGRDKGGKS